MEQFRSRVTPSPVQKAEEYFTAGLRAVREARGAAAGEERRLAFERASKQFTTVLEIDAHYRGARTNLAYCLIEMGRHGDAKREIEQVIAEFPDDVSALINYAVILEHNQRSAEAETYLRRAILAAPNQAGAYRDLAYLLQHRQKYRAAADNLERYLKLEPRADDERAVRQRIKLLRQRSLVFELPDRVVTSWGTSADLRRRALGTLIDVTLWFSIWLLVEAVAKRFPGDHRIQPVWVATLAFTLQLVMVEFLGGTLGHFAARTKVVEARPVRWLSMRALREACRIGPLLLGLVLPWPINLGVVSVAAVASIYSALSDVEGRAWFDRLTSTRVVEEVTVRAQVLAAAIWLATLAVTFAGTWNRILGWWGLRE